MLTNSELRKRKLERLGVEFAQAGGLAWIADEAGVSYEYLTQIVKGVLLKPKADGTRTARSLGDKLARKIEGVCAKPIGWFDAPLDPPPLGPDSLAIAEAFEALPDDTPERQWKRQFLYAQILGMLRDAAAAPSSAPAPALAVQPTAAPRPGKQTQP
jgi:hypothetical protein